MPEQHQFLFSLNQKVNITVNGKSGKVVGSWRSISGQDQFQIEFADDIGGINRTWVIAEDITA